MSVDPAVAKSCREKGMEFTEQYLRDLAEQTGHAITVEELKQKPVTKSPSKLLPKKVEKCYKNGEHTYAYNIAQVNDAHSPTQVNDALAATQGCDAGDFDPAKDATCVQEPPNSPSHMPIVEFVYDVSEADIHEVVVDASEHCVMYEDVDMYLVEQDGVIYETPEDDEIVVPSSLML